MTLTPAEKSALDALLQPTQPTLAEALVELGIDVAGYRESIDAEREYVEFILALAIEDLYLTDGLTGQHEVIHIARKYWPAAA